ncbi:RING-like zinc finger [Fragilaria crotonensis]|nr:RING-like zinc finger [Fragilaria crotonensis]
MNLIALIYSLLSCSSAYAASMRNVDPPFTSRASNVSGSASLSSCKVCMDGFRVSRLRDEIVELDNGGRVSCQFLEQAMNDNASCLFYTKGTNTERIRSTCTCEAETIVTSRFLQSTDAETIQGEIIDTLTTLLVNIVFPGFVILMFILCRKRCLHHSAVHSQGHESDSDDARKQRECALEVMFPPSEGEKQGRAPTPMSGVEDLESNESRSDDIEADGVKMCSICLEELESKSDDGKEIVMGPCSHLHHRECLLSWLKEPGHDSCPDCRQPMWDPKVFAMKKGALDTR